MVIRPCLYRQQRLTAEGGQVEIVCLAGGNHPLGIEGYDLSYMEEVCGPCPIPAVFTEEAKTCLYLLPLKIFRPGEIATLYQCRAFYRLNPKQADTSLSLHFPKACQWWFPHPLDFLPPGTTFHTLRALGLYLGDIDEPVPPSWEWSARVLPEPSPWWRRLLTWISRQFNLRFA